MPNYSYSTIARIGDLVNGIRVDTSVLLGITYMKQTQIELFNVFGRIKVHNLFGEVTVVISATATQLLFNYTSSTPVIAVQPMSAACSTMTGLAVGERAQWVGGAVATNVVLTATPGISDINVTPQIIGGVQADGTGMVGTIGELTSGASMTSGSMRFSIFYTPMSDGAYVTAVL